MERRPKISVLMPAYNAAPFLEDAVRSILGQTEGDFELVLINDGSTDGTGALAEELCAGDARIRYFAQENQGIVATLNRGLALCRGDFVARMDADDIARPDRFEKQLALLDRHPDVVICGSDADRFGNATGRIRKPAADHACRSWLLLDPCFVHPSVMFRRGVVDRGVRYRAEYQFAEDYAFWWDVAALGKMRNVKEVLLRYRFHGKQLTTIRRKQQQAAHVEIAARQLAQAGLPVARADLHDILWPQRSTRSRFALLLLACALFLRMLGRGKLAPYLMLATAWNILRHERAPAES